MYIDTHTHYTDSKFDEDRDSLLSALTDNNIGAVIIPGCNLTDSKESLALAEKYTYVYSAVGLHPEELPDNIDEALDNIVSLADSPKCVAIGEIGLDYYWDKSKVEEQKYAFKRQLELARSKDLPVIIHDRDAHGDCFDIVSKFPDIRGVFHCYSGSAEMAQQLLKLGWYLGFDGPITYKNARKALEVLELTPFDRILIETDSPYLPPVPHRGERNESVNLKHIVDKIAQVKEVSPEYIETVTTENALRLFNIKI